VSRAGAGIRAGFLDVGRLDRLAYRDSPVHRLDPRAKLLTTLVYLVCVVSFGKYEVSALLPYFLFPLVLANRADLPMGYLARRVAAVAPFAIFVGMFNPILDRQILLHVGPLSISGGWVSYASILVRFSLTIGMAFVLIATSSFHGVCMALARLGAPPILANQLLFLYRYLFVLAEEAMRLMQARALRSFDGRGMGMKVYGHILGNLLLRSLSRAQRVHLAMRCRGFDGEIRTLRRLHMGAQEVLFMAGWSAVFLLFRFVNLSQLLGGLVTGALR
jgi:cobalt/nickel transport system permease protein